MPVNCPNNYNLDCEGCRYFFNEMCGAYTISTPIKDILTSEERIEQLEKTKPIPMTPSQLEYKYYQLKAQFDGFTKRFYELMNEKKNINEPF